MSGDIGTQDCAASQKIFAVGRTKAVSSSVPAVMTVLAEPSTSTATGELHTAQNRRCSGSPEVPPGCV
jgi:hypothetical protein